MKTMTTDLLTFFQPGDDAGTAWTFSSSSKYPQRAAWAYAPGEVDLLPFANWDISSEEQFKKILAEAQDVVRKQGGILVEAKVHNDVVRLTLTSGREAGSPSPRNILRLRAFGDPRVEAFPQSTDLEAGDHLILPVSTAAEQRLEIFHEACKGFPTDLQSTLWNVIRRPSLEWRIQRIEEILTLPPANQAERQKSRLRNMTLREKLAHWLKWPIPAGSVALGLLLLAGACVGYERWLGAATATGETTTAESGGQEKTLPADTGVRPANSSPKDPPAVVGASRTLSKGPETPVSLETSLAELSNALKSLPADSPIGKLHKTHFDGYAGKEFSEGSPVVWGIAKLEALKLGLILETDPSLVDEQVRTNFKNVLKAPEKREILLRDTDALALLAWSACQRYGRPALLVNDQDPEPFLFRDDDCHLIKPEGGVSGLMALTKWVKDRASQ